MRKRLFLVVAAAAALGTSLLAQGVGVAAKKPDPAAAGCRLNSAKGRIKHVIWPFRFKWGFGFGCVAGWAAPRASRRLRREAGSGAGSW
jgi:hypothetical protein